MRQKLAQIVDGIFVTDKNAEISRYARGIIEELCVKAMEGRYNFTVIYLCCMYEEPYIIK